MAFASRLRCASFGFSCIPVLIIPLVVRAEEIVRYEATFDATWSASTHPQDFPSSPHFSGLIGGTHNDSVTFWEPGELASPGIRRMAELGSKNPLNNEVQTAIDAGTANFIISGRGIPRSPSDPALATNAVVEFDVKEDFSLVTLVSMIAPSPDWFVGVSGLDLRPKGEWLDKIVIDLQPYDAGTDSGVTFESPNEATSPAAPISHIDGFPFADTPPLGTFTFLRLVTGDFNWSGNLDTEDIDILSAAVRSGSTDARYDLNNSGVVDDDDRKHWVTDVRETFFGDANLDGVFDSTDLVAVFQAGQYEDGVAGNSTWGAGDWNGDQDFDSGDLVVAFQDGGFEQGPLKAQVVPEPTSSMSLWMLTGLVIFLLRKRIQ